MSKNIVSVGVILAGLLLSAADWPSTPGTTARGIVLEDGAGNKLTNFVTGTYASGTVLGRTAAGSGPPTGLTTLPSGFAVPSPVISGTITGTYTIGGTATYNGGTVGVAYGGTGLTAGTSGGILGFTATGTLASSAAIPVNTAILGGGAGAVPITSKITLTPPATGSTFTLIDGKTLTVSNTLTLSGTDASTITLGAGGTVDYLGTAQTFTAQKTFSNGTTSGPILANTTPLGALDSGATVRSLLQMYSDNKTYLDGGASGLVLRTNNTGATIGSGDATGHFTFNHHLLTNGLSTSGARTTYVCITSGFELINDNAACIVSAARFKEDFKPLPYGLSQVMKLEPKLYRYKAEYAPLDNKVRGGLIADNVLAAMPDCAIFDDNNEIKSWDDRCVLAAAIAAIQEQQSHIQKIKQ